MATMTARPAPFCREDRGGRPADGEDRHHVAGDDRRLAVEFLQGQRQEHADHRMRHGGEEHAPIAGAGGGEPGEGMAREQAVEAAAVELEGGEDQHQGQGR